MSLSGISLEEFATDPQLGGFTEASPAQKLVLRVIDGQPPRDAEQEGIFERIAGRPWGDDLLTSRRVVCLLMGVDSGKSVIASLVLLHRSLFADLEGLRPGQRAAALLVAPDTRLAAIPLDYAKGIVATSALIASEVESQTADSIRFTRGTEVMVLPASIGGRGVRGRRYVSAIMEETSYFRDENFVVNDIHVARAILVRLLPGAQLLAVSTPWRASGWAFEQHRSEFGRSRRTLVLQAPTYVMRPDRTREALAEYYESDPVMAASEIEAQFVSGVSNVFTAEELAAVEDADVSRRDPEAGFRYTAAMDPSGLRKDPWALTIIGVKEWQGEQPPVVQFRVRTWRAGTTVECVVEEIAMELREFGLHSVASDQYGSEVTKAHFTRAGVEVEERPFTSGQGSPKILGFRALKEVVVGRRISLLDDAGQRAELLSVEATRLPGGGERIAAPGRLHDDRVCALALAMHELRPSQGGESCVIIGSVVNPIFMEEY